MKRPLPLALGRAFTLVEILIVIVILGIVAALVVPQFASATQDAGYRAADSSLRGFERAFIMYHATHRAYPPDVNHGQYPSPMTGYLRQEDFVRRPPLGEAFDWNNWAGQVNIGIWASDSSYQPEWLTIDSMFDDGIDSSGTYQISTSPNALIRLID
ncbi:MAG: prepilin-type N-terminal cleavage/methylation domain-containing protein [Planctomycetota bacterium]|nr:prepilin-type N-terminal cleavage/methylation domain-containing protein [Planctomycetota bacterium]